MRCLFWMIANWATGFWQDVRFGLRQLRANPGFTAVAVLTLALGIGVNTSIFSLLNALMLRPLAVADSSDLLAIYRDGKRPCSYPDFLDLQQRSHAFAGLAAAGTNESAVDIGEQSEVVLAELVSFQYAGVLRVKTATGRWFDARDDRATDEFPAVISYRLWQKRFGGDPGVTEKSIRVDGRWYHVVGVAPKDFQGMALPVLTDIWVPLERYAQHNAYGAKLKADRQEGRVLLFGRLQPGVSGAQAEGELHALDTELRHEYPRAITRAGALQIERARGTADPGYRRMVSQLLMLLSVVAALVMSIACANVANLLLGRGMARRREVSIRLAMGASRGRICRQLLVETLLLSVLGAGGGLLAAQWTNAALEKQLAAVPAPEPLGLALAADTRVLAFSMIIALVATLLCGLLPAWQASKPDLVPALKGSEGLTWHRRFTLRNASVVAQVTLSLVLLIMAGLFVRALRNASRLDSGFESSRLLSARIFVPEPELNHTAAGALYLRLLDRIRGIPGVRNATLTYDSPTIAMTECVVPAETSAPSGFAATTGANIVGSNYFATFGIPLLRGREFGSNDTAASPNVAVVNETLARRYWPGQNALGRRLRFGNGCDKGEGTVAEVVGIANDAQYATLETEARPYLFLPFQQRFAGYLALVIRTEGKPETMAPILRSELHKADSRLRIYEIDTVAGEMRNALWQPRWEAALLSVLGTLALVVASVGLYGVISFTTKQRTKEFGIRMALGARSKDVLRLVMGQTCLLTLTGVAMGLCVSLGFTRLLRGFLYGLSPSDAVSYAGAALLWIAVALLASWVPARRALGIDPSAALREE